MSATTRLMFRVAGCTGAVAVSALARIYGHVSPWAQVAIFAAGIVAGVALRG